MIKKLLALGASVALVGCGSASGSALKSYSDARLETEADAYSWTRTSAPNVYNQTTMFMTLFSLQGSLGGSQADPNCPKVVKSGNSTTVEGGCTDRDGTRWVGKLSDKRDAAGSRTGKTTFDGFGSETSEDCNAAKVPGRTIFEGTIKVGGSESDLTFEVDLLLESSGPNEGQACAIVTDSMAYDYSGRIKDSGTRQTWNGSGRIGSSEKGVVSAQTQDEVLESSVCSNEALSGTTTVKAGSNTVVYTYDGAVKCDADSRVQWSLNGQEKGELAGVACTVAGPAFAGWGLLGLLGAGLLRRRRAQLPARR